MALSDFSNCTNSSVVFKKCYEESPCFMRFPDSVPFHHFYLTSSLLFSAQLSSDSTFSISLQRDPPSWKAGQSLGQLKRLQSSSRPLALTTYWIGQNVPTRFPINSPCYLGILCSSPLKSVKLHCFFRLFQSAVGGLSALTHMYFEVCIDAL